MPKTALPPSIVKQLLTHQALSKKVNEADKQVAAMASNHDFAKQLTRLHGIGAITALALYACIGKGRQFKNTRQLSAWLGLVPKQYGTGGIIHLGGIRKRCNSYLRTLLIHGGRTVFNWAKKRMIRLAYGPLQSRSGEGNTKPLWPSLIRELEWFG